MQTPWLHRAQAGGLLALTAVALVISYQGLYQVAVSNEVPTAWLWPLLVDAVGLSVSGIVWRLRAIEHSAWPARFGLYFVTAWSICCQAITAPGNPFARVVHGWAPLLVVCTFELLLWTIALERTFIRQADGHVAGARQEQAPTAPVEQELPAGQPALRLAASPDWKLTEVLDAVDRLHAAGEPVNGGALGRMIGKDTSTGRRRLRDYREQIDARLAELEAQAG